MSSNPVELASEADQAIMAAAAAAAEVVQLGHAEDVAVVDESLSDSDVEDVVTKASVDDLKADNGSRADPERLVSVIDLENAGHSDGSDTDETEKEAGTSAAGRDIQVTNSSDEDSVNLVGAVGGIAAEDYAGMAIKRAPSLLHLPRPSSLGAYDAKRAGWKVTGAGKRENTERRKAKSLSGTPSMMFLSRATDVTQEETRRAVMELTIDTLEPPKKADDRRGASPLADSLESAEGRQGASLLADSLESAEGRQGASLLADSLESAEGRQGASLLADSLESAEARQGASLAVSPSVVYLAAPSARIPQYSSSVLDLANFTYEPEAKPSKWETLKKKFTLGKPNSNPGDKASRSFSTADEQAGSSMQDPADKNTADVLNVKRGSFGFMPWGRMKLGGGKKVEDMEDGARANSPEKESKMFGMGWIQNVFRGKKSSGAVKPEEEDEPEELIDTFNTILEKNM